MRDFLEQIQQAKAAGLYYVALLSALALPDICGALDSPNGEATAAKYKDWFDEHVGPRYANSFDIGSLTGKEAYSFRCSMLHQGRTSHPKSAFSRIMFIEPGATTNTFHNCLSGDALVIDVNIFIDDIVRATEIWLASAERRKTFQKNLEKFVTRYPFGLAPYFVGVAVIS